MCTKGTFVDGAHDEACTPPKPSPFNGTVCDERKTRLRDEP